MNKTEKQLLAKSYLDAAHNWHIALTIANTHGEPDNKEREAFYRGQMKAYRWTFQNSAEDGETPASAVGKTPLAYKTEQARISVTHCGRQIGYIYEMGGVYRFRKTFERALCLIRFGTLIDVKCYLDGRFVA